MACLCLLKEIRIIFDVWHDKRCGCSSIICALGILEKTGSDMLPLLQIFFFIDGTRNRESDGAHFTGSSTFLKAEAHVFHRKYMVLNSLSTEYVFREFHALSADIAAPPSNTLKGLHTLEIVIIGDTPVIVTQRISVVSSEQACVTRKFLSFLVKENLLV